MKGTRVAELRPSQLLYTYGIGAVVDLPHLAVLVSGLDDWERSTLTPITEDRLLAAVKLRLGNQVRSLIASPTPDDAVGSSFERNLDQPGVPVVTLPRWLRCPNCDLLAPVDDGLFVFREHFRNPGESRYIHDGCPKSQGRTPQPAIPARFLFACDHGHLDDFPWRWFAHRGNKACREQLRLREIGITGEAADLLVTCDCGVQNSMAAAFESNAPLPTCRARRPHLRDIDPSGCGSSEIKPILLGATNSWFPVTLSSLHLPRSGKSELSRKIEDASEVVGEVRHVAVIEHLRHTGKLGPLAEYTDEQIMEALLERGRDVGEEDAQDLKRAEWSAMSTPEAAPSSADFQLREVPLPGTGEGFLSRVVLVERIREVTALLAFTRIRSSLDAEEDEDLERQRWAPLSSNPPTFVPATEVRGEGIFLQFDEQRLANWIRRSNFFDTQMRRAHSRWRQARGLPASPHSFPGMRYVLLHSFSHALMRALALDCGYAAASIRERIYSAEGTAEEPMAGILLYTAAPDAEGTLGGLVELGRPEHLSVHVAHALASMRLCSSDPLCAYHEPDPDGSSLHGAACHACLFAPETSCERSNRYLDRRALVDVLGSAGLSFTSTEMPR